MATEPISLATLISKSKRPFNHGGVSVDTRLFLGDRFALALTLSKAIYQLHYLGWLHKGIRSHNILFYRPSNARHSWRPDPNQVFLVGYEFARPASQSGLSIPIENTAGVAIYHHATYVDSMAAGYEPRFDLYSFGIVLIEIARWQTAEEMAAHGNVNTSNPQEWAAYVTNYLLPVVEEKMGQVYGDVVRNCIKGTVGGNGPITQEGYKEYLKSLDAEVVTRLELCFA